MRDVQSELIAELIARLSAVPSFGSLVFEDSVYRVLDAEDAGLPDDFIVIQEGGITELDRVPGSVREQLTLHVVPVTRQRSFAPALRAARLAIKGLLRGPKGGMTTPNVLSVAFASEEMRPPGAGQRLAGRRLQLTINYVQPYG